jgi:hypothetical protein
MKIIQSLVRQNGGVLQFAPGDDGRGTRTTVAFAPHPRAGPRKMESKCDI